MASGRNSAAPPAPNANKAGQPHQRQHSGSLSKTSDSGQHSHGKRGSSNAASASSMNHAGSSSAGGSAASSSMQLSEILGAEVSLVLSNKSTVKGTLSVYDATLGCLVLSSPIPNLQPNEPSSTSIRIVRLPAISSISILSLPSSLQPASPSTPTSSTSNPLLSTSVLPPVKLARLKERERIAVMNELRKIEREPPPGTSSLGQELFTAFGKTMPVRWTGEGTIIIMEEILLHAPYTVEDVKPSKQSDPRAAERVRKVLEGEREKLQRTRPEVFSKATNPEAS